MGSTEPLPIHTSESRELRCEIRDFERRLLSLFFFPSLLTNLLNPLSPSPKRTPTSKQAAPPPQPPLRRATPARPLPREASDTATLERPRPSILPRRGPRSTLQPPARAITPARRPRRGTEAGRCLRLSTTASSRRRVMGRGRRCTLGEFFHMSFFCFFCWRASTKKE